MRRSLSVFLAAAAGLAITVATSATLAGTIVFSDDFNKSNQNLVGTTPNTSGGNWAQTGSSATNPIQIASNVVALGTSGQDAYAPFTASVPETSGDTLHTSMDIDISAAQATGDYFSHLSDPVGTTSFFFQRLYAKSMSGGFQIGFAVTAGGGAAITYGTTVLTTGESHHVDIAWNFVAGATNDTFDITVDNAPYLSKTWDSTVNEPSQISAVNFRQGTASSAPTLTVDNLQVEVVPEPATLTLGSLIGLLAVAGRRSRRST